MNRENEEDQKSENSESDEEEEKLPSLSEASVALDTVHRFLLGTENSFNYLNNIDNIQDFLRKCQERNKQSSIMDYFKN